MYKILFHTVCKGKLYQDPRKEELLSSLLYTDQDSMVLASRHIDKWISVETQELKCQILEHMLF